MRETIAGHTRDWVVGLAVLVAALVIMACSGCSSVSITQRDGPPEDRRETVFKARTLFDSKNELAKLRTTNTEKSQGIGLSELGQESSGSNVVSLVERVTAAAVRAAVGK